LSYANGTLIFNVPGFSTYEVGGDDTYTLTASKKGSGAGYILGIDSSSTIFSQGTMVNLDASAEPGSVFTGWNGDCLGINNCQLIMNNNRTISASFDLANSGNYLNINQNNSINNYVFKTNLTIYRHNSDVIKLQQFLNSKGYSVSKNGSGSIGFETDYFGPSTRSALARFQFKNNIKPAVGYFGNLTRSLINSGMGI
jgi:hypothetical protein